MSEEPALLQEAATKPCKICAEPIRQNARKCTHCDSYQDWHSNIGVSSTVLSLLVALISVLTTSIPILKRALAPRNSSLSFVFQGATEDIISVLVTNQGSRPGSVGRNATISVAYQSHEGYRAATWVELALFSESRDAAVLINPDKSTILNYREILPDPIDRGKNKLIAGDKPIECDLSIHTTDFAARETIKSAAVNCDSIKSWIANLM